MEKIKNEIEKRETTNYVQVQVPHGTVLIETQHTAGRQHGDNRRRGLLPFQKNHVPCPVGRFLNQ
jgi:hypothetical protein